MRCYRIFFFAFFAIALTACAAPRIPSPDYAGMFAGRFAAEFDSPETAKEAWLEYGGSAVRKVQESVYPPVSYQDFSDRAVARIREVRAAYPDSSPELLSFVAMDAFFDPVWMTKPNRNAVHQRVGPSVLRGQRVLWPASIFDKDERFSPDEGDRNPSYSAPAENGLGIAMLKVPTLNYTLDRGRLDRALFKKLEAHQGAIALDLRGNQGGLVPAISRLSSFFLPAKTLVFTNQTLDEAIQFRTKEPFRRDPIGPVLVIVDQDTNGGAIAIAAALQDHGVGQIAGAAPERVKSSIDDLWFLDTCPPDIDECGVIAPTGQMIRSSGIRLSEGLKVDYPIDPQDNEALVGAVKTWLGETKIATKR